MNETTQYVITAAVFDIARRMALTADRKLTDAELAASPHTVEDFIPKALDRFLACHHRVQTLLADRPLA